MIGTFPAVHRLQHPLVIAIVWGHPLSAHAVRGEIPVPLLRRGHCPPFVSSQNNKKSIKYPWRFFPLVANSISLASICPSGSSQSMQSCGHNPLSASQTYDFSSLLSSQTPHSLIEFGSALLLFSFFFFLLLSPFSLAHFLPFIASGACGLRSLGLSLWVMCECVFSGASAWRT